MVPARLSLYFRAVLHLRLVHDFLMEFVCTLSFAALGFLPDRFEDLLFRAFRLREHRAGNVGEFDRQQAFPLSNGHQKTALLARGGLNWYRKNITFAFEYAKFSRFIGS